PGPLAEHPRHHPPPLRQRFRRGRDRLWPHRLVAQYRHHPSLRADSRRRPPRPEPRLCAGARHDPDHRSVERRLHLAALAQRTVAQVTRARIGSWLAIILGAIYFVVPLLGTFEFSLRMRRGEYSFD